MGPEEGLGEEAPGPPRALSQETRLASQLWDPMAPHWSPGWYHSSLWHSATGSLPAPLNCTRQRGLGPFCGACICVPTSWWPAWHMQVLNAAERWKELESFSTFLKAIETLWAWATQPYPGLATHFPVPPLPSKAGGNRGPDCMAKRRPKVWTFSEWSQEI